MVIYLDNAATTYPKPPSVYQAHDTYLRSAANPGRGAHRLSLQSARTLFECRVRIAQFLGIADPTRLVFTGGCTIAINMALKGLKWKEGDLVITSSLEHNSVMRPLKQLELCYGIKVLSLRYAHGGVDLTELAEAVKTARPRLCVISQASNLTGDVLPVEKVAAICRGHGVILMVDAAQSAGVQALSLSELPLGIWCASGHKSLMGPPGVGLLYIAPELDLEPLVSGGTGSESEALSMPGSFPDRLESGTMPGPAIAGLAAGVDWLAANGPAKVAEHERRLSRLFLERMQGQQSFEIFGPPASAPVRSGIVAFRLRHMTADRVADLLDSEFDIAVRAGLHCAALAHKALGTLDSGLVRASFGPFNTESDVDSLCYALEQISVRGEHVKSL